jgi:hypothetical protein
MIAPDNQHISVAIKRRPMEAGKESPRFVTIASSVRKKSSVVRFGPRHGVISTHTFGASRVTLSVNAGAIKLTTMSGAISTNRRRLVAGLNSVPSNNFLAAASA